MIGYFQGSTPAGTAQDQTRLRELVPERERRSYRAAPIIETLCDEGSVMLLRERFAPEMVTALSRLEGLPIGIIANNTMAMAAAGRGRRSTGPAGCRDPTPRLRARSSGDGWGKPP